MKTYLALTATTTDLNLAPAFFFQFLLSSTTRAYYLSNIINGGVVRVRNVDSFVFLGRLVIRRRHVSWIHQQNLRDQGISLPYILIFETLLLGVHAQTCFLVVDRLWAR
jgi:hypothetical protein